MSIAYLQCDMRFNNKLLADIGGAKVVEHTINRIKNLNCNKIIAGIYECEENEVLIKILETNNVNVLLSDIDNVNARLINTVKSENTDYVVRIGGDQVLFDSDLVNKILEEMIVHDYDWFWEEASASILPDIVSKNCLCKYEEDILKESRYFTALKNKVVHTRYRLMYPCILPFDFRVNSNEGFRVCRHVIEKHLNVYDISKELAAKLTNKNNYLNKTGLMGSWLLPQDYFVDEAGKANPWWGKTMVDFVIPRLNKGMKVFEWGAGNSTLFWCQYVDKVVSIEYDYSWYIKIKETAPNNAELKFYELEYDGKYCKSVLEEKDSFDIILIDGRDRVRCAFNAVERLKDNGVIIWDNSEREEYQAGYRFLASKGFKRIELSSIIYGNAGVEDFTSVFYRTDNVLNI